MQRCLQLAQLSLGKASSNPMVGAVIVHNDRIIGEGYYQSFGGPHAEVNAIANVAAEDEKLLIDSTVYVSLEPCSYFGKTPPCSDLLIKSKVRRVIIASLDPNPKISGAGIDKLRSAGIEVITGILQKEGDHLNRRFFSHHTRKRPWVILKWAQSSDGFITKDRNKQHWITGELSKKLVHQWRQEEDAILVGAGTVMVDNPQLTDRYWKDDKQPTRVVLDTKGSLPKDSSIFNTAAPTLLFTSTEVGIQYPNAEVILLSEGKEPYAEILGHLYDREIQSVIIEGGQKTLEQFITANLWDEVRVFIGPIVFNKGVNAPTLSIDPIKEESIGDDTLSTYLNNG